MIIPSSGLLKKELANQFPPQSKGGLKHKNSHTKNITKMLRVVENLGGKLDGGEEEGEKMMPAAAKKYDDDDVKLSKEVLQRQHRTRRLGLKDTKWVSLRGKGMQMVAHQMMAASSQHEKNDPWTTLKTTLIFLPASRFVFDWLALFGITVAVMMVPISVAFGIPWEDMAPVHLTLGVVNFVDVIVNFRTAVTLRHTDYLADSAENVVVLNSKTIAIRYIKGWFLLDVLCCLDLLVPALPIITSDSQAWVGSIKLLKLLTVSRYLLSISQVTGSQKFKRMNRRSEWWDNVLSILKLLLAYALGAHLLGCAFFWVGRQGSGASFSEGPPNWLVKMGIQDEPTHRQYVASIYWALTTLISVGYGDITPSTPNEQLFCSFAMLMGAVIHAGVFGSVNVLLHNMNTERIRYKTSMGPIHNFIKIHHNSLPPPLRERVARHAELMWETNKGYDVDTVLRDFPSSLQTDVKFALLHDLVAKVPFFESEPLEVIRLIVTSLRPHTAIADDAIITKGELSDEMYFLKRGMAMVEDDEGVTMATLLPGSCFGEISFLTEGPRTVNVVANTSCEYFSLSRKSLEDKLEFFPDTKANLLRYARRRLRMDLSRIEQSKRRRRLDNKSSSSSSSSSCSSHPPRYCTSPSSRRLTSSAPTSTSTAATSRLSSSSYSSVIISGQQEGGRGEEEDGDAMDPPAEELAVRQRLADLEHSLELLESQPGSEVDGSIMPPPLSIRRQSSPLTRARSLQYPQPSFHTSSLRRSTVVAHFDPPVGDTAAHHSTPPASQLPTDPAPPHTSTRLQPSRPSLDAVPVEDSVATFPLPTLPRSPASQSLPAPSPPAPDPPTPKPLLRQQQKTRRKQKQKQDGREENKENENEVREEDKGEEQQHIAAKSLSQPQQYHGPLPNANCSEEEESGGGGDEREGEGGAKKMKRKTKKGKGMSSATTAEGGGSSVSSRRRSSVSATVEAVTATPDDAGAISSLSNSLLQSFPRRGSSAIAATGDGSESSSGAATTTEGEGGVISSGGDSAASGVGVPMETVNPQPSLAQSTVTAVTVFTGGQQQGSGSSTNNSERDGHEHDQEGVGGLGRRNTEKKADHTGK